MKRRLTTDTRPSWRDPDMPVLRDYKLGNGKRKTVVEPEYEREYRKMMQETSRALPWDSDPTYDLKRKR